MADGLKQVGVELVAQNQTGFTQAIGSANNAVAGFGQAALLSRGSTVLMGAAMGVVSTITMSLGEFIVPELLQDHATPENLEQALGNWLDHRTARDRLLARYDAIHDQLRCGNDERVAQALAPWLSNGSPHAPPATAREPELATLRGR